MVMLRRRVLEVLLVALLATASLQLVAARLRFGGGGGGATNTTSVQPVPAIPEPAAFAVFALGAGLVGLAVRRRRKG